MRLFLACLLVLAAAAPAAADPVTVVSGPKDGREDLVASIAKVRGLMTVCWQRKPAAPVKIAITVGTDGAVTKSAAKSKGPAAQCAAGILAVSTLAAPAKKWTGVVAIEAAEEGKARDVRAIEEQLGAHAKELYACQKKATSFAGKVALKVTVEQSGRITAAKSEAEEGGATVGTCVEGVAKKLTLEPIESQSITYSLTLSFAGGDGGSDSAPVDPALQPSKKGPLEQEDLMPVIEARKNALAKCSKGSKAKGKVVVRVAIGSDGKVSKAKIKSSEIGDTKVEDCLVKVFAGMTFREAGGETVVLYPMMIGG
jgi:hypothetical protein